MPSYSEIKRIQQEEYPTDRYEQEVPRMDRNQEDLHDTQNQRKVHFSEDNPEVYNIPESGYYGQEYENQDYKSSDTAGPYNHLGDYDDYKIPAGRNYTNPNIEKHQYERKFNRSTVEFSSKDTAKDLFTHPESESPLDTVVPRQQKVPIEYEVKKTDMKIADTESELKKCEERLRKLQLESDHLHRTAENFNQGSSVDKKYLGEEQKQIFSGEDDKK